MSQVEVCCFRPGSVFFTVNPERVVEVEFKFKNGVNIALVDQDVAEHILDNFSPHEYFKPGAVEIGTTPLPSNVPVDPSSPITITEKDKDQGNPDPPAALTKEGYGALPNLDALKSALADCSDKDLLMDLVALESNAEKPRKSWLDAMNARIDALSTSQE